MGGPELDYCLMALQPCIGSRQWPQGVSTLKQCTGQDHWALETLIVVVSAGAIPDQVLCAIWSLVEFIFQAQNLYHYEETFHTLQEALREFHFYKQSIIDAGGRKGKNGILDHFEIPKLELMQFVVHSIRAMGAAYQWTSDITEHCHIVLVKQPYCLSNQCDFHSQCCQFLDCEEKMHLFTLFTTIKTGGSALLNEMHQEANQMATHYPESQWISQVLPDEHQFPICTRQLPSLFKRAHSHISANETTAFLLTRTHFPQVSIEDASDWFMLPDLCPALGDWFLGFSYANHHRCQSTSDCTLPFTHIRIWNNIWLQQCSAQDQQVLVPVQTVQALQPSTEMPFGRYHMVLVNFLSEDNASQSQDESMYCLPSCPSGSCFDIVYQVLASWKSDWSSSLSCSPSRSHLCLLHFSSMATISSLYHQATLTARLPQLHILICFFSDGTDGQMDPSWETLWVLKPSAIRFSWFQNLVQRHLQAWTLTTVCTFMISFTWTTLHTRKHSMPSWAISSRNLLIQPTGKIFLFK